MKVLVADDSGVIRCVIKRALFELGVEDIDEAANGSEGICLIKNERYDLIVTDWNMPCFTGLDLIKAARAEGLKCPIIMQTTESQKPLVLQAIAAGCNDYIVKPFTKEYMVERLERFVVSVRQKLLAEQTSESNSVV
jgi:two-component system, chemotaxis family, chemotaxis protein CheY